MSPTSDGQSVPGVVELTTMTPDARAVSTRMVRGDDGQWRYDGTDVVVPGAVDVPLSDRVDALQVGRPDDEPVAVLVSVAAVTSNPELAFIPAIGRLLMREGAEGDNLYEVPWASWQEHASRPVDVDAPELGTHAPRRRLALAERQLRFARWRLEQETERRAREVSILAALGMTRREASELLGVTPGRVQQLVDDLRPEIRLEVDDLLQDIERILRAVGEEVVPVEGVRLPAGRGSELLAEMADLGLLALDGNLVSVTRDGERAEMHLRTQRLGRKASR